MKSFKKWIEKKRWELKLKNMDFIWALYGGYSWQLFPPSFYYKHSPEEIQREEARVFQELDAMILKYEKLVAESKNRKKPQQTNSRLFSVSYLHYMLCAFITSSLFAQQEPSPDHSAAFANGSSMSYAEMNKEPSQNIHPAWFQF